MLVPRSPLKALQVVATALFTLLAGCEHSIVHPLSSSESAAITGGHSAVVLLRFSMQDQNGKGLDPFAEVEHSGAINERGVSVGDFDSGGEPKLRDVRTLSIQARNEGWLILTLPPGYYYLVISKAVFGVLYSESPPRWRIEVPPGVAVIYAGTIRLHVTTGGLSGYLFGRPGEIGRLDEATTMIEDESGLAVQAARRDLPTLPPPVTRLAVRHTGPLLLGIPPPLVR